ncbi:DUF1684 domain-containing protein [Pontibacter amylolyticus]|uniref:DUF1684 domain-containing protein n=1 Tax=Pontibacter amylolyticus TaxID=1424080 RepID=A0ABQ1WCC3_9BACT|nr:DUF1684 domain-containing protein [Pontibacter amylolyticus]GGG22094.1 hypothetical protein GCM10011323_27590 [Pontibacter amylolyticus]
MLRLKSFTLSQFLFIALILTSGCTDIDQSAKNQAETTPEYVASVDEWHQAREAKLKEPDGWLTLAGLFWLQEGDNTFGSGPDNSLTFPEGRIPGRAGVISLKGDTVTTRINPGVDVLLNGAPVREALLYTSGMDSVPKLSHGSLTWFVIKRGNRYGIRLRDLQNDALVHFKGIKRFPVKADWRVQASFVAHPTPKQIPITNIVGQTSMQESPGTVIFTLNGEQYQLDALLEGEELFIIFADKTNGLETYGAGRYLYADKPGPDGTTLLDFNKASNPPCDFVSYATCPLPPRQNFLPIMIEAGEKSYGEY